MRHFLKMATALLLAATFGCTETSAASLDGSYVVSEPEAMSITLHENKGGAVTGELTQGGQSVPVVATRNGDEIAGHVGGGDATLPFKAHLKGQQLQMELGSSDDAVQLVFRRAGAAVGTTPSLAAGKSGKDAAAASHRKVSINGADLGDTRLQQIEQAMRMRIADGDYWYDPVLGAWGVIGGPTRGFLAPGLDLGGAMQPGVSSGDTGVFVNGRHLHRIDVLALQQITGPIIPGRYFITSQGLAGYEGGPPLWNLVALAQQQRGGGGGGGSGDNIWSSLTGAGNSSGGCSYVNTGGTFSSSGCD